MFEFANALKSHSYWAHGALLPSSALVLLLHQLWLTFEVKLNKPVASITFQSCPFNPSISHLFDLGSVLCFVFILHFLVLPAMPTGAVWNKFTQWFQTQWFHNAHPHRVRVYCAVTRSRNSPSSSSAVGVCCRQRGNLETIMLLSCDGSCGRHVRCSGFCRHTPRMCAWEPGRPFHKRCAHRDYCKSQWNAFMWRAQVRHAALWLTEIACFSLPLQWSSLLLVWSL